MVNSAGDWTSTRSSNLAMDLRFFSSFVLESIHNFTEGLPTQDGTQGDVLKSLQSRFSDVGRNKNTYKSKSWI